MKPEFSCQGTLVQVYSNPISFEELARQPGEQPSSDPYSVLLKITITILFGQHIAVIVVILLLLLLLLFMTFCSLGYSFLHVPLKVSVLIIRVLY